MKIKLLNETQKEQVMKLLGYYKFFYICNECGSVYGADFLDKKIVCPTCELNAFRKAKEKKK